MADNEVRYIFRAIGETDVLGTFRSIDAAAKRSGTVVTRSHVRTGRSAKRSADAQLKSLTRTQKLAQDVAADQARSATKAEGRERALDRGRKIRARGRLKRIKDVQRARAAAARDAVRQSKKEADAAIRAQKRVAAARAKTMRRIGGGAVRGILGAAGVIGGAAALVGGRAVTQSIARQDAALRLSIQAERGAAGARGIQRQLEGVAGGTRGVTTEGVLAGVEAFVIKTGDVDKALEFAEVMAKISIATGAATEDMGAAMADLFKKFDIKTVEDMNLAMSTLAVQGKKGAFELRDAAAQFPKLAAAAQGFGLGKGVGALATLGGLTQIARTATGGPKQAATAIEAMFRQLTAQAPALKRAGVNVFRQQGARRGETRDIRDILVETVSQVGGTDIEKKKIGLQKIFGEEGIRALRPLISTFSEALLEGKDGVKALRDQLDKAIDAQGAVSEINRDAADAQTATSARLTSAWEKVVTVAGERLAPMVAGMAEKFADFINETDFTTLETSFVALAEAAEVAADVLGFFASDKRREELKRRAAGREAKRLTKEQAELEKIEGPLSFEQTKRLEALPKEIEGLSDFSKDLKPAKEVFKSITSEEFEKKFAEGTKTLIGIGTIQTGAQQARDAVRSIIEDPSTAREFSFGRSEEIKALVAQFAETVRAAETLGGPAGEEARAAVEQTREAALAQLEAAKETSAAAAKLAELGRPSVFTFGFKL